MIFRGLYTALVTPFDVEDKVDERVLRQLLRFQISAKVDGIVVLGTTGEAPTLTHAEKAAIIKISKEEIGNKMPLIVGTGSYSTAQVIESTLEAHQLGADAALIVTPYYNRPTQEGLYCHFEAICRAVNLPIIVYNHHVRTGQNLQTATMLRIADLPNICGIKEVSQVDGQFSDLLEGIARQKEQFAVLTGDDAATFSSAMLGGDGVISVASNLIPHTMRNLTHAALSGQVNEARELHYALMPLFRSLCSETNPIPVKAAMQLSGLAVGGTRLPLSHMVPENVFKLRQTLSEMADILAENSLIIQHGS